MRSQIFVAPSLTPSNPGAGAESKGRLRLRVREETYLRGEAGQMRGDKLLISRGRPDYSIPYYL